MILTLIPDRTHVDEVEREIENAANKYELFITSLNTEMKARKILLTALDQADRFYRNQRRDVKKVVYVSCLKVDAIMELEVYHFSGIQKLWRSNQDDTNGTKR